MIILFIINFRFRLIGMCTVVFRELYIMHREP